MAGLDPDLGSHPDLPGMPIVHRDNTDEGAWDMVSNHNHQHPGLAPLSARTSAGTVMT